MATSYPGGLDNFASRANGATIDASHINDPTDAVEAVEAELGVNPSGAAATVAARLATIEGDVAGKAGATAMSAALAGKSDATHNHSGAYVQTVNGVGPDGAGNVTVAVAGGSGRAFCTVPSDWGATWKAARANAHAGTGLARVVCSGSSITRGSNGPSNINGTGMVDLMRAALQSAHGDGGSGFTSVDEARTNNGTNGSRVAYTGSWTISSAIVNSQAQALINTTSVGASMTFTVRGSTIKLWYLRSSNYGQFTWSIDGGATTTVDASVGTPANVPFALTLATGLANTNHTVTVTCTVAGAGGLYFAGCEGLNASGVVVHNLGHASGGSYTGFGNVIDWQGGQSYPCDLLVYELNVNDFNAVSAGYDVTWSASFRSMIDRLRSTNQYPDILLWAPHIGKWETTGKSYHDACVRAQGHASTYGIAFANIWGYYRASWDYFNSLGGWSAGTSGTSGTDNVHPSDAGAAAYWTALNALVPQLVN